MARDDERRRRNAASRVTNYSTFGSGGVQLRGDNPILSPEDNPAYQAAIAGGRPARNKFTNIPTPSGGSISVPIGSEDRYSRILNKLPSAPTGFERPNAQAAYALGNTGAIPTGNTPYEQSYRMGYQGEGVVQQPQPSFGFQIGNTLRNAAPGIIPFAQNAASRIASAFGFGGGAPSLIPSANAGQPTPTPPPIPAGSPTPSPTAPPITPVSAPVPQNTALQTIQAMQQGMTPQQALAQNQPRRYSDMYP